MVGFRLTRTVRDHAITTTVLCARRCLCSCNPGAEYSRSVHDDVPCAHRCIDRRDAYVLL